jgi:dTDP-4-dehydrorhamnose reductase
LKVLVLGSGQIASAVGLSVPTHFDVVSRSRADLDITDAASVKRALAAAKADWIVNAAAYTAVDRAEDEPGQAQATNDTAVATIVEAAAGVGSRLLHLSTDFVFDGKSSRGYLPSDATNPLSVYGATKLAGEQHVIRGRSGIVLRTSWVYASHGKNFVLTMLKLMKEREQIGVVADQIGSPTWAASAARAIWGLIDADAEGGIYHWTDLGVASWYDLAIAIQDEALERGLLPCAVRVLPIPSASYPTRAVRPAFSVLNSQSTRIAINAPGVHWRHNLRKMLDEIRAT